MPRNAGVPLSVEQQAQANAEAQYEAERERAVGATTFCLSDYDRERRGFSGLLHLLGLVKDEYNYQTVYESYED